MEHPPCLLKSTELWDDSIAAFRWLYKSGMSGPEPNFTATESLYIPQAFNVQHQWTLEEIEVVQEMKREQERLKHENKGNAGH